MTRPCARRALGAALLAASFAASGAVSLAAQEVRPAGAPEPPPAAGAPESPPASAPEAPQTAAPQDTPEPGTAAPDLESLVLQPGEVARIGGLAVLSDAEFDRYLATVYARLPEGDAALKQLVGEALIAQDAAAAGMTATEADIDKSMAALDEQVRQVDGNSGKGFEESVKAAVSSAEVRGAVRLLVLHERLVRAADGLAADAPITPAQMKAWLDARIAASHVQPAGLDDPLAAVFDGGSLDKQEVGARLRKLLGPDALAGVLTELIGVQLVRARADLLGVDLTTAAVAREILERDTVLKAQAGAKDVSYAQFVESVQKRSLEELMVSDRFSTEVLLRELTERSITEEQAKAFWEKYKVSFQASSKGKLGPDSDWEAARNFVWRELRQRTYRALFEQSRIARRF